MKVLLIEDDQETAAYIVRGFSEHGHTVDYRGAAREGLLAGGSGHYDVMIVDRMLPEMDGLSVVKMLRGAGVKTPILFLTTMTGIDDRVEGLNAGGDDYLAKPFSFFELLARANALTRRPPLSDQTTVLRVGDLEMNLIKREVRRGGQVVDLQQKEFQLLEFLMRHAGHVVTRTMLLEGVWDYHFDPKTNIVETHISRLRSKIDKGRPVELLLTIRGSGYSLRAPAPAP
jgi:two-component system OmpR family response regulator